MTTGLLQDQNLEKQIEKQMGCMTGFLHIFDRHQMLAGKRLYATTKRLPSCSVVDSASESDIFVGSPDFSKELLQQQQQLQSRSSPEYVKPSPSPEICSPAPEISSSEEVPAKMPLPLPVFEFKDGLRSSWKFRESPRLSLDSRATFDGKGSLYPREIRTNEGTFSVNRCENSAEATEDSEKQRRSPSVIARLMGLEALPGCGNEFVKKAELRRSASESRVSRDLLQYRFIDGTNSKLKQPYLPNSGTIVSSNVIRDNAAPADNGSKVRTLDSVEYFVRKPKSESLKTPNGSLNVSTWKSQQQPKSFFDSQDFFPEPKHTGTLYGEIEKRLKMRGIDEPAKDLETLKQILEALQLKGLLHSKKMAEKITHRNFVYDHRFYAEESPIVVMKPSRSPLSTNRTGRTGMESSPSNFGSKAVPRRNLNLACETLSPVRDRRDRPDIDRNLRIGRIARVSRSPDRNESSAKSPSSLARRKPLSVETQRRTNDSIEQRRSSPIQSPKFNNLKIGSDQTTNKSPRNRKPKSEISAKDRISSSMEDESSTISESSISTSSQKDSSELQRSTKMEDYKEGRSLLERCDKLLHSIAEITASDMQPSPVSVLDSASSFYKDESSPSPVNTKRRVDFKDRSVEIEDENWNSPVISPVRLKAEEKVDNEDCDFMYVSEILQASECLSEDCDVFLLLEKQHYRGISSSSRVSRLHRKLVFDTISEILDRKKQLPPWKVFCGRNNVNGKPSLGQIWIEFQRIRERDASEELFDVIFGVLRKDIAGDDGINGWRECMVETSEAVLDIERLIFKDLVVETIRELAVFAGRSRVAVSRRKLVF